MKDSDPQETGKQMTWALRSPPTYCLGKVSRLQCRWGDPHGFWGTPELRRPNWKSGETKVGRGLRTECWRRESCTDREPWRCAEGPPQVFSRVQINTHVWGDYLRPGERTIGTNERTVPSTHTEPEMAPTATSKTIRTHNSPGME